MKRYILLGLILIVQLFGWSLIGSRGDVNLSDLNLTQNDLIWSYDSGVWKTSRNTTRFKKIEVIRGGNGFWSKESIKFSQPLSKNFHKWTAGWNLVSPVDSDWNMKERFDSNSSVLFGWNYDTDMKSWSLYSKKDDNYGFPLFEKLRLGEGAWISYVPIVNLYFGSIPIYCKDGTCKKIITDNSNFLFKIRTDAFETNLKIGFDLYRYSNDTHYKFAFGPFEIDMNSPLLAPAKIPVCVEKSGTSSCKNSENSEKFAYYKDGYLIIDSQKIASLFDKSIPNVKESFSLKLYINGFNVDGFAKSDDFGTIGIEGFGLYITIKDNSAVVFDVELQ